MAIAQWTGIDGETKAELVKFYSRRPARPLRAFYRQPDETSMELPFRNMQIAWFEGVNLSQAAGRPEPQRFEVFSFSTAMGLIWRLGCFLARCLDFKLLGFHRSA